MNTTQLLMFAPTLDNRITITAWGTVDTPRPDAQRLIVNMPPPADATERDSLQFIRDTKPGIYVLLDTEDAAERARIHHDVQRQGYTGLAWIEIGDRHQLTADLPESMRDAVEDFQALGRKMQVANANLAVATRPRALGTAAADREGLAVCPKCQTGFKMIALTIRERSPLPGDLLACGGKDCKEIYLIDNQARIVRPRTALGNVVGIMCEQPPGAA